MSMRAWQVAELGEPAEVLRLREVPEPVPGPGQVLVEVAASAMNFADSLLCRGEYQVKPPRPFTPGLEVCGRVLATGDGVTSPAVGERVLGSAALPAGGFADRALMDASAAFPVPDAVSDVTAAALYIGYQTSWFALHRRANLRPGEHLLVHAASGGVGSSAVQLGKAAGAHVIGVVGGQHKVEVARALGCDVVIDRKATVGGGPVDLAAAVLEATDGHGADVVYDPVGGPAFEASTRCIAFEGRIVVIGFASGTRQQARLNHALVKNYTILGLHWSLYLEHTPDLVRQCHDELLGLAADGRLEPLIAEVVGLEDVPAALGRLTGGGTTGRIVVRP
ncbi:NADPH:quinone oxidoreductase family protein [Janibacter massiliensis]|uniref:NADPH:quinone oxidoreductase family protein n=1 Tax=Janibacter massiliensis TaxID=2058291 RepID=UPI001F1CBCCC|nr:NADPH:quinone oxidoreductase family protein [Janibacter massiliensis]